LCSSSTLIRCCISRDSKFLEQVSRRLSKALKVTRALHRPGPTFDKNPALILSIAFQATKYHRLHICHVIHLTSLNLFESLDPPYSSRASRTSRVVHREDDYIVTSIAELTISSYILNECLRALRDTPMDAYDSDDARPRSPLLEPQTIRYKPSESPPPFLPEKRLSLSPKNTPPSSPKRSKKKAKKRRNKTQPSQGDSVLISYLDPNRPDIAREAGERTLNSASQSEPGWSDDEESGDRHNFPPNDQASNIPDLATLARGSLIIIDESSEGLDPPGPRQHEPSKDLALAVIDGVKSYDMEKKPLGPVDKKNAATATFLQHTAKSSVKGRRTPKIKPSSDEISGDAPLATSPNLRKFTISASEGSPMRQLPAIQKSPCQSASPDGGQSLPSLSAALAGAEIMDQDARMDGAASPIGCTGCPPTAGQLPPLNRTDRQIAAHDPLHQRPSATPSLAQLSPQSSKAIQDISPPGSTHLQNEPLPPNGPSAFKCTHPGCAAPPFQTQYLLK
jgi:hypothetical protein